MLEAAATHIMNSGPQSAMASKTGGSKRMRRYTTSSPAASAHGACGVIPTTRETLDGAAAGHARAEACLLYTSDAADDM
eukprot:12853544-Alexandrium_andersonii.AAC.1